MRKEYMTPDMEIVKIQTTQMLAASAHVDFEGTTDDASEAESHFNEDFEW